MDGWRGVARGWAGKEKGGEGGSTYEIRSYGSGDASGNAGKFTAFPPPPG
jgi:hypothetical protein